MCHRGGKQQWRVTSTNLSVEDRLYIHRMLWVSLYFFCMSPYIPANHVGYHLVVDNVFQLWLLPGRHRLALPISPNTKSFPPLFPLGTEPRRWLHFPAASQQ